MSPRCYRVNNAAERADAKYVWTSMLVAKRLRRKRNAIVTAGAVSATATATAG